MFKCYKLKDLKMLPSFCAFQNLLRYDKFYFKSFGFLYIYHQRGFRVPKKSQFLIVQIYGLWIQRFGAASSEVFYMIFIVDFAKLVMHGLLKTDFFHLIKINTDTYKFKLVQFFQFPKCTKRR